MEKLNDTFEKFHHIGRLVVLDKEDENGTVHVIFEINEKANTVKLVELDRPNDGKNPLVNLSVDSVYLLNPLEVVERVTEWK